MRLEEKEVEGNGGGGGEVGQKEETHCDRRKFLKSNFRQDGQMEKQRWEESERRRKEVRRSEKRKSKKKEDAGARRKLGR